MADTDRVLRCDREPQAHRHRTPDGPPPAHVGSRTRIIGGRALKEPVNLDAAFDSFEDLWRPRIIAHVNEYDVKLAKLNGEFVWHQHDHTDELFLVVEGSLRIEMEDRDPVRLRPGDLFVVPRGVRHKPIADDNTQILLLEPRGTVNTGDDGDGMVGEPLLLESPPPLRGL